LYGGGVGEEEMANLLDEKNDFSFDIIVMMVMRWWVRKWVELECDKI
jgi:hypothetical protein